MRLLHLSDIHYGAHGWLMPGERPPPGSPARTLVDALLAAIQPGSVDGIVVTGDLTQSADPGELAVAAAELKRLAERLEITPLRVIVTPGNHDVSWARAPEGRAAAFAPWRDFLLALYGEPLARDLYHNLDGDELVAVHEVQGKAIATLSSCYFESDQDHFGYVGGAQLERLAALLEPIQVGWKIVAMHHHLLPTPSETIPVSPTAAAITGMDLSVVRDSGVVLQRLGELGVGIVMHGHKHEPVRRYHAFADGNDCGVYLLGNGSAGVRLAEVPQLASYHARIVEPVENVVVRVQECFSSNYQWRKMPAETLTQGYDELRHLEQDLQRCTVDRAREINVYQVLHRVAGRNSDWSGRDPGELMGYVAEGSTTNQADNVFWWAIVHGVFQFRDMHHFHGDGDDWKKSVAFVQLSVRGALLLNRLAQT